MTRSLSNLSTPTITTLSHPKRSDGELAAQWITTEATEHNAFIFEPELIVRVQSQPKGEDDATSKASNY